MRKLVLLVLVLAVAVPLASPADHCGSNIVVFSGNLLPDEVSGALRTVRDTVEGVVNPWPAPVRIPTQPAWVNSNAVVCLADPSAHDYDTRFINPGATHFSLRYTTDLGVDVPSITAVVSGMGFTEEPITMDRVPGTLGAFVYDSVRMPFANPAATDQFIFVAIQPFPDDEPETNCFHTVIGSCPDF